MKIVNSSFVKSVSLNDKEVFFDTRKEIIFVGRSNVGKSSIMNALMKKKDLVKTSSKPGKTRNANIFLVNEKHYFTDLPGYGFAKLGMQMREELDGLISWYTEERKHHIKATIMLIDSKIGPQQSDIDMYEYLTELGMPIITVLSKTDRLSKNEVSRSMAHTEKVFFGANVFAVSSLKKIGVDELRKEIGKLF